MSLAEVLLFFIDRLSIQSEEVKLSSTSKPKKTYIYFGFRCLWYKFTACSYFGESCCDRVLKAY